MDFYITFCANGLLENFPLSDNTPILNHGFFHLQNKTFPSVFAFEENGIFLKSQIQNYKITDCSADLFEDCLLYDGMFIDAISENEGYSYQIFVQDVSQLAITHRYYYLENEITIGSGQQCHINGILANTLYHDTGKIQKQGNRYVLYSNPTYQAIYVNGKRCSEKRLNAGDMIWTMGVGMVFMGEYLALSCRGISILQEYPPKVAEFPPRPEELAQLERPPRVTIPLERGVVEISPPSPKEQEKLPVALTSVPSYLLIILALVFGALAGVNVMTFGDVTQLLTYGIIAGISFFADRKSVV